MTTEQLIEIATAAIPEIWVVDANDSDCLVLRSNGSNYCYYWYKTGFIEFTDERFMSIEFDLPALVAKYKELGL